MDGARVLASYWRLQLEQRAALRARIGEIMARCSEPAVLAWIQAMEYAAEHRQVELAEVLLETGAFAHDVEDPCAIVSRLDELCEDECYRDRAAQVLRAIAQSRSPVYALDGFELANEYAPDKRIEQHGDTPRALAAVRRAMAVIGEAEDTWRSQGFALVLWERCGQLDGFAEVLAELPWEALGADGAFLLAELLARTLYVDDEASRARLWERLRRRAGAIASCLQRIDPRYRAKASGHFECLLFVWGEQPRSYDRALSRYLELLPRLCTAPLAEGPREREALSSLSGLAEAHWRWIQTAPPKAWRELEGACRRNNDTELISDGLWTMGNYAPRLTARAFATETRALMLAAKALGCMPAAMRAVVLEAAQRSALFRATPALLRLPELIRVLDGSESPPAAALVSRRLRDHVRGARLLPRAGQERARARIIEGWDRVLLGRIEAAAMEQLASNLRLPGVPRAPAERHALLFQRGAAEHRRSLRKLLAAHFAGNRDYPLSHPVNQRWLAAHPAIDAQVWTRGIELRCDTAAHGPVIISLELDPLEVLRMGTYVGTCFGLGGSFAYSAAAVALDINKRVAYCRDARGTFLARQVLALSEAELLYCYEIYPASIAPELQAAFFEFDRLLSTALGAPLYGPEVTTDDDDEVALLLARNCYFDLPIDVTPALLS